MRALAITAFGISCVMAACSSEPPTAITFTPSTLFAPGVVKSLVVRVYGNSNQLVFCKDYPVDETAPPGVTASLFSQASSITLAPGEAESGPVRIVAELYSGEGSAACMSGDATGLLARKVAIVRYAAGKTLPLRAVFELSCLGVLSCNENSETCAGGECVTADLSATGIVVAPCFDFGACPTLARAKRIDACTFELPSNPERGYMAAGYSIPSPSGDGTVLVGASVLSLDEYQLVDGNVVELRGSLCEKAKAGFIPAVYFGYECDPPYRGAAICGNVSADPIDSPLGTVLTGSRNDGGLGTESDGAVDQAADAPRDGSVPDVSADGSPAADSAADADARVDAADANADASDGGRDAIGGDGGATTVECALGPCSLAVAICCRRTTTDSACEGRPSACANQWRCDDEDDCSGSDICCRQAGNGGLTNATCMSVSACNTQLGTPVCSAGHEQCPAGLVCVQTASNSAPGRLECQSDTMAASTMRCGAGTCSVPEDYCCANGPQLECLPRMATCLDSRYECDDLEDCQAQGRTACCRYLDGEGLACANPLQGDCGSIGLENMCSQDDTRCPDATTCVPASVGPYFGRRCEGGN